MYVDKETWATRLGCSIRSRAKGVDAEDKLGKIVSWFGKDFNRDSQLAFLDIAIIKRDSDQAIVLIEIEESTATPKVLLGDTFATLLGDQITFRGESKIKIGSWTTLVVLAHSNTHQQLIDHLERKLNQIKPALLTGNASIGQVAIDTFQDKADLETKLIQ